jgi:hypothetical protein
MKLKHRINTTPTRLVATALMAASALSALAQTGLNPVLTARPLTPGGISSYNLPSDTEVASGLFNVGVGQPLYLEVDIAIAYTNSATVTWALSSVPAGSSAAFTTSPLGSNVPVYEPSDQLVFKVAGRTLLRPDVEGKYIVVATVTTPDGTTNLTQEVTAGTYMGIDTCKLCHSGGEIAEDMATSWETTGHAHQFENGINGVFGSHYSASCIECHTVGYDTNTNANNGGFDDIARQLGWTFPTVLDPTNWDAVPHALQNLANIQCENCHGPGSQHAHSLGDTSLIGVSLTSGDCAQCHNEPPHHSKVAEWDNSVHAVTTRHPAGEAGCVICHTAAGFLSRGQATTNTDYVAIDCQTCHEPHGKTVPADNPHLIRTMAAVTFMDGTTVTNAGEGTLCMNCHHARQDAATYAATAPASAYFGPHHGPQGDMIEGVNGFTYGQDIPSSAHRTAVPNTCPTCHMQTVASTDPDFTFVGGHTFKPGWDGDANHPAEDLVAACQGCHGPSVTSFDFPLQDYDGDGVIDGVQTEVQHLLDKLSTLLPPLGSVKSSLSIDNTWSRSQLEAGYNWQFVNNDGSLGIHNTAYAVGLLKASIANLTGDANNDEIADSWQVQYFGSINNPEAAPNATPAGDGIPNWLKYSLGIDPTIPGMTMPDGVVWADGKSLANPGGQTNTVQIYTAAEISFNTQAGATYQIQSISSLSGGWQNVGQPIQGTGKAISYLTPTRDNLQQYYRVVTNP